MSERRAIRIVVSGHVQGVGFRAWMQQEAEARGLTGWVRNRRDGNVEAVFAGAPETVEAMIEICRQGPPGARVGDIERTEEASGEALGRRFVLRSTL